MRVIEMDLDGLPRRLDAGSPSRGSQRGHDGSISRTPSVRVLCDLVAHVV